jgi:hypothetical protein
MSFVGSKRISWFTTAQKIIVVDPEYQADGLYF